jgi:hypothetical protein
MTLEQAKAILRASTSGVYFGDGHIESTLTIDGQMTVEEIQALAVIVTAEGVNFSLAEKVESMTNDEIFNLWSESADDAKGINIGYPTQQHRFAALIAEAERQQHRFAALIAEAERQRCIDIVAMCGGSVEIEARINQVDEDSPCIQICI